MQIERFGHNGFNPKGGQDCCNVKTCKDIVLTPPSFVAQQNINAAHNYGMEAMGQRI